MRPYYPLQPPAILRNEFLESGFQYREYKSGKAMESYIACYWTIHYEPTVDFYINRIIPDGCVDIIFDLETSELSGSAFLTGLMTSCKTIHLSSKNTLFGIRFYIESAHRFFGCPVSELNGCHVLLEEIWGNEAGTVAEQLRLAQGIPEMIERIELKLINRIFDNEARSNELLQTSINYMYSSQGAITIRSLADELGYSERNLRRIFVRELGVSPKELSSIIRFQFLLRDLPKIKSSCTSASLAVEYGYYDQSHLIKSFKRLYGLAPGQVFETMSVFYNNTSPN